MKLPFISQKEHKQILDNLRISQNKQISDPKFNKREDTDAI